MSKAVPSAHGGCLLPPSVCQSAVSAHGDLLSLPSVCEATVSAHGDLLSLPPVSEATVSAHGDLLSLPPVSEATVSAHSDPLSQPSVSEATVSAHGGRLLPPSVCESAPTAHHTGTRPFPIERPVGGFLVQVRELLHRLLRAWTGENPLQQRPTNHLDYSLRPPLTINAVIPDSVLAGDNRPLLPLNHPVGEVINKSGHDLFGATPRRSPRYHSMGPEVRRMPRHESELSTCGGKRLWCGIGFRQSVRTHGRPTAVFRISVADTGFPKVGVLRRSLKTRSLWPACCGHFGWLAG